MKLFKVVFDIDAGPVDPPEKGTKIRREERFYAAASAETVWEDIKIDRMDEAMNFVALIEYAPSVRVLPAMSEPE